MKMEEEKKFRTYSPRFLRFETKISERKLSGRFPSKNQNDRDLDKHLPMRNRVAHTFGSFKK